MCKYPVGLGAKRVRIIEACLWVVIKQCEAADGGFETIPQQDYG